MQAEGNLYAGLAIFAGPVSKACGVSARVWLGEGAVDHSPEVLGFKDNLDAELPVHELGYFVVKNGDVIARVAG